MRIGEAAVPGPPREFTVISANVTAAASHWEALSQELGEAGVLVPPGGQDGGCPSCRGCGPAAVCRAGVLFPGRRGHPLARHGGPRGCGPRLPRGCGGGARRPAAACGGVPCRGAAALSVLVRAPGVGQGCGPLCRPGAGRSRGGCGPGGVPVFILGDFNQAVIPARAAARLAGGGWFDLGRGLGPTCRQTRAAGGGSRIDYVFCNPAAKALVSSCALEWGYGLCTHAAFKIGLQLGAPPSFPARRARASLASAPAPGWDPVAAEAAFDQAWAAPLAEAEGGGVDRWWATIEAAATAFLVARGAVAPGPGHEKVWTEPQAAFAPKRDEIGRAAARPVALLLRRSRQLRQAVAEWPLGEPLPEMARRCLKNAAATTRACPDRALWEPRLAAATSRELVEAAAAAAQAEYSEAAAAAAQGRRDKWHEFAHTDLAAGGRGLVPLGEGGHQPRPDAALAARRVGWRPGC